MEDLGLILKKNFYWNVHYLCYPNAYAILMKQNTAVAWVEKK